jgi:trigger factor
MKVDVTDLEQSKKAVTIEIPEEIVTSKINQAYRQVSLSTAVKGFRPGKAPKDLLKARFWDKIESGVIKELVPEYFEKAVEEQKLQLIGQPQFEEEELHIHEHSPLAFKVIVTTWPRVELPQNYRQLEVAEEKVEVTQEDVLARLRELQEKSAEYRVISDRPIKEEDLVVFDYDASEEENPSWRESKKDAEAIAGLQQLTPGFHENIIGMAKGEEKEFEEAFPANFPARGLAGRKISFKVNVKEIKEKILPEIDDDFAKDLGADSLATLKGEIAEDIKKIREGEARSKMANSLLNTLLASISIEPPELLIESETESLIDDIELQLATQGKKLEKSEEKLAMLKGELRESAIRSAKSSIALEEVAFREGIKVSPEEIDHQTQLMAKRYNQTAEEVKKAFKSRIERTIQEQKTLNFLLDHAVIR